MDSKSKRILVFGFLLGVGVATGRASEPSGDSSRAPNSSGRDYTKPFLYDGVPLHLRLPGSVSLSGRRVSGVTTNIEFYDPAKGNPILVGAPTVLEFLGTTISTNDAPKRMELLTKQIVEHRLFPMPSPHPTLKPLPIVR